jgi:hypothetical protein
MRSVSAVLVVDVSAVLTVDVTALGGGVGWEVL